MNKNFEWTQDMNSLTIKIPIRKIDPLKINVTFYSNFAKVNISERSMVLFVDFFDETLFEKSKWEYSDCVLILKLEKMSSKLWDSIEKNTLSKIEIKQRRNDAILAFENAKEQKNTNLKNMKMNVAKEALEENWNVEKKMKQEIEQKIKIERENGIRQIFDQKTDFIENSENDKSFNKIDDSKNEELAFSHKKSNFEQNSTQMNNETYEHDDFDQSTGNILTQKEIQSVTKKLKTNDESSIRTFSSINKANLPFTKKVFSNLAARDHQHLMPNMPKSSSPVEKSEGENFMWYKQKGDLFLKNNDLKSAANAYVESLKLNPNNVETILNYATLKMKVLDFDNALTLINESVIFLEKNSQNPENDKLYQLALTKKVWIETQINNFDESIASLLKLRRSYLQKRSNLMLSSNNTIDKENCSIENSLVLNPIDEIIKKIDLDIVLIEERKKQDVQKNEINDLLEKNASIEVAINMYEQNHQNYPKNEKFLSNLAFYQTKSKQFEKAIESIDLALNLVLKTFDHCDLKTDECVKTGDHFLFLVKLFSRKIDCLLDLGDLEKAEIILAQVRCFDEKNEFLLQKLNLIRRKKNLLNYENKKKEFSCFFAQNLYLQAFEVVCSMRSLLDTDKDQIEILKLAGNKSVCLMKLEKFNDVIAESIVAENAISKIKANVLNRLYSENKHFFVDLLQKIRFRKAFALNKLGQVYNAKKEMDLILEIDPNNQDAKLFLENFSLYVC